MEKHRRVADSQLEMVPLDRSTIDAVTAIGNEAYPPQMRMWDTVNILGGEYVLSGVRDLSFLARDKTGKFSGYCIAFLIESEVAPTDEVSMYVADVAVLPNTQGAYVGLEIAREIMSRANQFEIDRVEFHARESTTYRALFESSHTQQILAEYGYTLAEHGLVDSLTWTDANDVVTENGRLISLQKIINTFDV